MNIYEKLSEIQAKLKAPKLQFNSFGNYKYRNAEDILEAVKPICKEYKAVLVISDKINAIGTRHYVEATATLIDLEKPEDKVTVTSSAREDEALKGMTNAQMTGSASSYARKYALNGLFNIDDTKDSDYLNTGGKKDSAKPAQSGKNRPKTDKKPAAMTLSKAKAMTALKGDKEVRFDTLSIDELQKLAAQDKRKDWQEAAQLILDFKGAKEQAKFKAASAPFPEVNG
nr:MAG TPA: ERF superfamily protein [Caudoviricetes sp.]